ncbi:hypothetical protein V2I01_27720 [Micromonospora sp. BRA006-A]|nr:hypothetical protein [Micromonospora sp. BRA006-A]
MFNPVGPGMPGTTLLGRVAALLARLAPGEDLRTGPPGRTGTSSTSGMWPPRSGGP